MGKEFYGNFGCLVIELTFPRYLYSRSNWFMTNRNEVLPKELVEEIRY